MLEMSVQWASEGVAYLLNLPQFYHSVRLLKTPGDKSYIETMQV